MNTYPEFPDENKLKNTDLASICSWFLAVTERWFEIV
jgi:hypothetical protein